jgi:hypothetical protein
MAYQEKEEPFVSIPRVFLNLLLVSELTVWWYQLFLLSAKQPDYLLLWTLGERKQSVQEMIISEYFYMISLIPNRLIFRITSF